MQLKNFKLNAKKCAINHLKKENQKINEMIKAYSNKLDLDFELFRFVEGVAIFKIHKIKELV